MRTALSIFRRDIRRIMRGEESRFSFHRKAAAEVAATAEENKKSRHRIDELDEELKDEDKK